MKMKLGTISSLILLLCAMGVSAQQNGLAMPVLEGEGFSLVVPPGWQRTERVPPAVLMQVVLHDRKLWPLLDGSLSPLIAGITIEEKTQTLSLDQQVRIDRKELQDENRWALRGEVQTHEMTLADGTAAQVLTASFIRKENGRLSIYRKLYCRRDAKTMLIGTAFITCSEQGATFIRGIKLPEVAAASLQSLVLQKDKADVQPMAKALDAYNKNAAMAVVVTSKGNDLLETDPAKAAEAFEQVIQRTPELAAAHNGLAWALLHDRNAENGVERGLAAAKRAVELTSSLDYSALDTLALAELRSGHIEAAQAAIDQALKLSPDNTELQRRAKEIADAHDARIKS